MRRHSQAGDREEIVAIRTDFRAFRARYDPRVVISEHAFEGATLNIPFSGSFNEQTRRTSVAVDSMQLLYNPPGYWHRDLIGPSGVDGVVIELSAERDRELRDVIRASRSTDPLLSSTRLGGPRALALARELVVALNSEAPARLLFLEAGLLQMLALLGAAPIAKQRPRWIETVLDALHAQFPRKPSLAELAALVGVHPIHLAQSFKRHTGRTIGAYVEGKRIETVCLELKRRRFSLVQIAELTGFSDQSHMGRVFRRALGCTPAAYRRSF